MKKALRLLSMVMAVVMIMSAACLPTYAKTNASDYSTPNRYSGIQKYYFTAEQGCSYILDMLDEMLAEENMNDTWEDMGVPSALVWMVESITDVKSLDMRSIDNLIQTLYTMLHGLATNSTVGFASALSLLGNIAKEDTKLLESYKYLKPDMKRANGANDLDVLYMIVDWLGHLDHPLEMLARGDLDLGVLSSVLGDYEAVIKDLPGFLKLTIYQMLVDSTATAVPAGVTLDGAVQQVIDWALITGTGDTAETGAASLLGANEPGLLPALGNESIQAAGGASITAVPVKADRGNGVVDGTMNTYQFVANLIDALMSGMVKDMLMELLIDELDIDITANEGKGNTDIMTDMTFNLIVGAVEELFIKNGAPAIHYSADALTYPVPKLNELMDWLLTGTGDTAPAIGTFISLSYKGINLTDNFMSLLNDVARMLPSLLPAFGLELNSSLAYSPSDLAETLSFNENKQVVFSSAEDAVTPLYLTYEEDMNGNRIRIYPTEYTENSSGVLTPSKYVYFSDDSVVNTTDPSNEATYINPMLIRPEYYISDAKVYANLIKLLLSSFIDGAYFPEWTEDIPSVAAYALAAVAMNIVPEGEYYDRLDAYYYNNTHTDNYISPSTGKVIDKDSDLDYTVTKTDSDGKTLEIVYAAGEIGAAIGAYYLNGILDIQEGEKLTVIGSSLEQFGFEFLIWAFKKYLPIFAGTYNAKTGLFESVKDSYANTSLTGTWTDRINTYLGQVYEGQTAGKATVKADANFNVVYNLIDDTLFSLIPITWLPATYDDAFDFVNKWLLDSIQNFDLQQLFSLFSIREGGELDTVPLLTLVVRVVDRVLAIAFGGNSVLAPVRDNMFSNGATFYTNNTSITSLDALLGSDSLAVFLPRLVTKLNQYKAPLLETVFPLIISANYLPAFDAGDTYSGTNYLGTDLTTYKISTLQDYLKKFNVGVNAKSILDTTDKEAAQAKVKENPGSYIYTQTLNGVENYTVYQPIHFFTSATETSGLTDKATFTDSNGVAAGDTTYSTFSNFGKATLNTRSAKTPFVSYTTDGYRFLEVEDFSNAYSYNNFQDALDDASDFVGDYKSFGKGDESNGYGDWMKFYIQSNLKALNLYDANDDGVIVTDTAQATYDGNPGAPKSSFYPFMTTASQNIEIYFAKTGKKTTVNMQEFNSTLYEQIAIALAYGADPANDIVLSSLDAEPVVRLALKKYGNVADARALAFDITPDIDGNYHTGAYQWSGLTAAELQAITDFCASIDWTFTYDATAGTYEIARPAFALITPSMDFGNGISTTPAVTRPADNKDIVSRTAQRMYDGYVDYITELYTNRRNLYNHINIIGKRAEMAESDRKGQRLIDTTSLNWLLKHTESAYKNSATGYRNRKFAGNGYSKIYTASSYAKFKNAYDFASSLEAAVRSAASAEGLTQSMVSKAFDELMEAFMGLVDFTGAADWYKLEQNLALAEPFINNANAAQDYTSDSFNALKESYEAAKAYYDDQESYDCEQQDVIDAAADDLYAKIFGIIYTKVADLNVKTGSSFIKVPGEDSVTGAGTVKNGFIIGLKEGFGIKDDVTIGSIVESDNVTIEGMTVNDDKGMTFKVAESKYGYGTGAYYTANNGVRTVFNYFAVLYGDLNGDMRIDGTDKLILQGYLMGEHSLDAAQTEAADVNHDDKVDATDVELIQNYYRFVEGADISQTK